MGSDKAGCKSEAVTVLVCNSKQKMRHRIDAQEDLRRPFVVVLLQSCVSQGERKRVRLGLVVRGAFRAYQSGQGLSL